MKARPASPGQLRALLTKGKVVTQANVAALKKKKDVAGTRKKGGTKKGSEERNKRKRADVEDDSEEESRRKPHKTTTKKRRSHKKIASEDEYREEEKDDEDESDGEPLAKKSRTQSATKAAADKPTEPEIEDEVAKASDPPQSPSTLADDNEEQDDDKVWVVAFDSKHIPKNRHERGLVHLIKQEEGVWRIDDLPTWVSKPAPSSLCTIIAGTTGASNAVWNDNGIKLTFAKRKKLRSEMANLRDVSFFVGFQL